MNAEGRSRTVAIARRLQLQKIIIFYACSDQRRGSKLLPTDSSLDGMHIPIAKVVEKAELGKQEWKRWVEFNIQ